VALCDCNPRAACACGTLQVWDMKDAGLQAASRVAAASDPLALLTEISQNFLSMVSSLTRQKVCVARRARARAALARPVAARVGHTPPA
jgi:hypothetical protein